MLCCFFAITNKMLNKTQLRFFVLEQEGHRIVRSSAGGHGPKRWRTADYTVKPRGSIHRLCHQICLEIRPDYRKTSIHLSRKIIRRQVSEWLPILEFQFSSVQFIDSMPQLHDRMTEQMCRQWKRTKRHQSALTIVVVAVVVAEYL